MRTGLGDFISNQFSNPEGRSAPMPAAFLMAVDLRRLTATFEAIMGEGKTAGRASNPRSTGSLDVHFGEKLRARRLIGHVSQQDLAKALGMSFQQIQKYEKGTNRISAAMLFQIAAVLKVDVAYFYEGLLHSAKNSKEIKAPILIKMSLVAHGPRLMDAFLKLKSDNLRRAVADLAQALVREG
jgi:transcriptional regulator with XRE-family HTH domain